MEELDERIFWKMSAAEPPAETAPNPPDAARDDPELEACQR